MKLTITRIKRGFNSSASLSPSNFKDKLLSEIGNQIGTQYKILHQAVPQRFELEIIDKPFVRFLHRVFYRTDDHVAIKLKGKLQRMHESTFGVEKEERYIDTVKYKELKQVVSGESSIYHQDSFLKRIDKAMKKIAY